jgi:DNA sulfur modification protein DndD
MMLLKRIEIENFGPYYGRHELEFKGDVDELILVYGENMAGKTSLLNAIRWCLYGEAKDRAGGSMPTRKLINGDAWGDGDRRVSVTLEVIDRDGHEDTPVRLKRQRQARARAADPSAEKDFTTHCDVQVAGNILAADKFDDTVNSMLPPEISRFFLFDGELLREYEELLQEDSTTHARQVKRAIEMILGLPAVQTGKKDLAQLLKEASRAYNKEAKKHADIEESARAEEKIADDVDRLEEELESLRGQQEQALTDLRRVKEELSRHEHLADSAKNLAQAEERLQALEAEKKEKQAKRRDQVKEFWRDVLEPRLKHETEELEHEQARVGEALREKHALEKEKADRLASLSELKCVSCGQDLPEELRLREQSRVDQIDDRLQQLATLADQSRLDQLGTTIRRMREIAPAGVASAIGVLENDLSQIEIKLFKEERRKSEAEADLRGVDKKLVPDFEQKRDQLNKHLGHVEGEIAKAEEMLTQQSAELKAHRRAMKEKDEPTLKHLRIVRDLLERLLAIYEASVSDLTDGLREDVERQASEIFRELTTDKTYSGLRINENYGLTILDAEGREVPVRSAGAEQIVALSLIGALNRLAARRGPVIMDTPFGRLDRRHRENILRFVPTLADQVALLVHSGEIDPERDLEPVKGKITAEVEILHGESARSELVERV